MSSSNSCWCFHVYSVLFSSVHISSCSSITLRLYRFDDDLCGEHQPILPAADVNKPKAAPTLPKRIIPRPVVPKDWSIANKLPDATVPADPIKTTVITYIFFIYHLPIEDCHAAAVDPAAMPPILKPNIGNTTPPKTLPTIINRPLNFHKFRSVTIGLPHLGHRSQNSVMNFGMWWHEFILYSFILYLLIVAAVYI